MFQLLRINGVLNEAIGQKKERLPQSPEEYQRIYSAMCATRVFYDHCERLATKDQFRLHIGPRGQEAAEVASACALEPEDTILYYARSYGAVIARGVSFRSLLDSFHYYGCPPESCIDDFLQHRIILPYTWVGMHLPHAVGVAWAEKMRNTHAIAVAYFGDGATAEGDFHGAMEWASVFDVPVVFVCENNQYAISTPSRVQNPAPTFAAKAKAYNMASLLVDGNDALAMYAAMKRAATRARNTRKPMLIEALTYRDGPHTSAVGAICLVPGEEKKRAREIDPLKRIRLLRMSKQGQTLFGSTWSEEEDTALSARLLQEINTAAEQAYKDCLDMYEKCRTQTQKYFPAPYATQKRVRIARKENQFVPNVIPNADCRDGVNFALYDAMRDAANKHLVCIGQDIGEAGGVMRTTALPESFVQIYLPHLRDRILHFFLPLKRVFPERIFDAPLNEPAIAGVALGLSIAGMHPIFEMQFSGFVQSALHHIQEFGCMSSRHRDKLPLAGICRLPFGHGDRIEYHNGCEIGQLAAIPGIIVCCPSTPQDFYDMMFAATMSDRFVAFFENLDLYRHIVRQDITRRMPTKSIEEFGVRIARVGTDITIASYGRMLHECLNAADELAKNGISAEVLDLRIVAPLDAQTLLESVKKTGRFLAVQEECAHGFGAYLVSVIADEVLEYIRTSRVPVLSTPCSFPPPPRFWEFHVPTRPLIMERAAQLVEDE